jgi:hypothetical protein
MKAPDIDTEQAARNQELVSGWWGKRIWQRPRFWLWGMALLQLFWLLLIRLLRISAAPERVLPVFLITLLLAVVVIYLPTAVLRRLVTAITYLAPSAPRRLGLLCAFFTLIGVIFATQQRVWLNDEKVLYETAVTVSQRGFAALQDAYRQYPWLARQHPPLAATFYGYLLRLVGPSLLAGRLITLTLSLTAAWLTFRLGRRLFSPHTGLLAAIFLLSMPLVYRLGTVVMLEVLLLVLTLVAVTMALNFARESQLWRFLLLMLTVVVGFFVKYTMVLLVPALVLTILFYRPWPQVRRYFLLSAGLGAAAFVILLLVLLESTVLQMQAETLLNYASLVLTDPYGRQLLLETMTNRLPSAIGVYHAPLLLLGAAVSLQAYRTAVTKRDWWQKDGLLWVWIVSIWVMLSLTLPDHRYFLATFPALALLMGRGAEIGAQTLAREKILFFDLRLALITQLFALSTLPIYVDWIRVNQIFVGS